MREKLIAPNRAGRKRALSFTRSSGCGLGDAFGSRIRDTGNNVLAHTVSTTLVPLFDMAQATRTRGQSWPI